jgi:precorrin-2 dehydrogenase/sirohydrochlorin ferrochelatase
MAAWPIMLQVEGRRCVIVGGGSVALRRARSLLACGAGVVVVAPQVDPTLATLAIEHVNRPYAEGDLAGALLTVIATDDPAVNQAAAAEAQARGVLINRTDAPDQGDFVVPAHERHGPVTLAVDTDGISAAAAATIRRELSAKLDPDWPRLLELASAYRQQLQRDCADGEHRRERLRRLTDERAMNILKDQGEPALHEHLTAVAAGERPDH